MQEITFEGGPLAGQTAERPWLSAYLDEQPAVMPTDRGERVLSAATVPWRAGRVRPPAGYVHAGAGRYRHMTLVRAELLAQAVAAESDPAERARLLRYQRAVSGADPRPGHLSSEHDDRGRRVELLLVPDQAWSRLALAYEPDAAPTDVVVQPERWRRPWGRAGQPLSTSWWMRG